MRISPGLAGASVDQFLQPIARRHSQVVDALSGVDENQLVVCEPAELRTEFPDIDPTPDGFDVLAPSERITRR
jgi:hypothetical protein